MVVDFQGKFPKRGWCLAPIDPAQVLHDSLSDMHECTRNFAELSIMPRVGGPDLAHFNAMMSPPFLIGPLPDLTLSLDSSSRGATTRGAVSGQSQL